MTDRPLYNHVILTNSSYTSSSHKDAEYDHSTFKQLNLENRYTMLAATHQ
jgi:hypothetical protein